MDYEGLLNCLNSMIEDIDTTERNITNAIVAYDIKTIDELKLILRIKRKAYHDCFEVVSGCVEL